jgi:hypothetical protein
MSKQKSAQERLAEAQDRERAIIARLGEISAARAEPDTEGDIDTLLERGPKLSAEFDTLQSQLTTLSRLSSKLSAEATAETRQARASELDRLRPKQDDGRRGIVAAIVEAARLLAAQEALDRECQAAGGYKTPTFDDLALDLRRILDRWAASAGPWVILDASGYHVSEN